MLMKRGPRIQSPSARLARENRALSARALVARAGKRRQGMETGSALLRVVVGVIWLAVIVAAVALGWKLGHGSAGPAATPEPATPAANVVKTANSGVDEAQKKEVLKRIDVMPNVTAASKERLYVYVERARS